MSGWHRAPKGRSVDTSAQDDPAAAAVEVATRSPIEATSAEPAEVTALEATEVVPTEPDAKADDSAESVDGEESNTETTVGKRRIAWSRVFAYGVLPALVLLLALASGFFKWQDSSVRASQTASIEAVQTARDSTIKMLSYKPDTLDQQLNGARDLLTGEFRDSYTSLINDVVIPGAREKQISAVATIPAIARVTADPKHAVVLVFVNQTVVVGQTAPTDTASSVRVTLDNVDGRWLVSEFKSV